MTEPQQKFDDEITKDLDSAFLDIAKTAARRTLALIDQGKIPGYRRCTGYEDGNPERRDMGRLGGQEPVEVSGLYDKYEVTRSDGREDQDAEYIVLRVDAKAKNREAALLGVRAYAKAIKAACPDLAADLYQRYGQGAGPGMEGREENLLTTEGMDSLIGRGLSDLAGHEERLDIESWMVYVGAALGLIPKGLRDWKALIYCSPAVCDVLHAVVQLLIERRVLVLSHYTHGESFYRLPNPEERWAVDLPRETRVPKEGGGRRLLTELELSHILACDGLFYIYDGMDGRRGRVKAEPAYLGNPGSLSTAPDREDMTNLLTDEPNSVPREMLDGPLTGRALSNDIEESYRACKKDVKQVSDDDIAYLLCSLRACFSCSRNPSPTIREMADHLRCILLGVPISGDEAVP